MTKNENYQIYKNKMKPDCAFETSKKIIRKIINNLDAETDLEEIKIVLELEVDTMKTIILFIVPLMKSLSPSTSKRNCLT